MTKVKECEMCGVKQESVKMCEVIDKETGYGFGALLCLKCVADAKEDKLRIKLVDRSFIKTETEKEATKKICPLLSIATLQSSEHENEFTECLEEQCAFYLEKLPARMEKCVFVRLALSVGMIAEQKAKNRGMNIMQQSLKRRMESAKRQHRAID